MKNLKLVLIAFIAVFTISCDKNDDTPGITVDAFTGSWEAISATYTNHADPAQEIEIISKGADINFTILDGGKVRTWVTFGTFHDEWDAVVIMTNQTNLVSTPVETSRGIKMLTFELENDILTLINQADQFDFTLMGEPEVPATSVIVLARN